MAPTWHATVNRFSWRAKLMWGWGLNMSPQGERTTSRHVTGQGGSVPQLNNNGHVFATEASHLDGHRLWSNRVRDGPRQFKTSKTRHLMSTPKNHSRILRLWHTTATDDGEWWTAQHVGPPPNDSFWRKKKTKKNFTSLYEVIWSLSYPRDYSVR